MKLLNTSSVFCVAVVQRRFIAIEVRGIFKNAFREYVPCLHTSYHSSSRVQSHKTHSFLIIYPHYALLTEHIVTDVLPLNNDSR